MLIVQGKCQFIHELTLDQKELARLQVLNNVLEHRLLMDQAAELMGVTERHAWRILAAYRKEGAAALSHGRPRHIPRPIESTHFTRAMRELGVQQIFARSPQAKGRGERAAGTFQDRLVTELRLARASTIQQASEILERFIPRFNANFAVKPEQPDGAYRPLDPSLTLAETLCFKHSRKVARDSTVEYNWRTLQLLPGEERPSYAGAKVEVLELPDGSLRLQHEGKTIPAREAPKSPGALRATGGAPAPTPEIGGIVNGLVKQRLTQPQLRKLASLEPLDDDDDQADHASPVSTEPPKEPVPTPRRQALWKAVHHAKLQGLSLREIAREPGIARNTLRHYARASTPPANRPRVMPKESPRESLTQFAD